MREMVWGGAVENLVPYGDSAQQIIDHRRALGHILKVEIGSEDIVVHSASAF